MQIDPLPNGTRAIWHGTAVTHLRSDDGASAVVADHGAHLLSWCPAGGVEALFLSTASRYGVNDAIRGGVPIIFPQFGEHGAGKRHGIARSLSWQFLGATLAGGVALARWTLCGTLEQYCDEHGSDDRHYRLGFDVRLGGGCIELGLVVENTGTRVWQCHAALHTYLRVDDLAATSVIGLQGQHYIDQVLPGSTATQDAVSLEFAGEVDRIHADAPSSLLLCDGKRRLQVGQDGFADTVIWNPGAAKAAALSDLQPQGQRHFVCIEAAAVVQPLLLVPAAIWRGTQTLQVYPVQGVGAAPGAQTHTVS